MVARALCDLEAPPARAHKRQQVLTADQRHRDCHRTFCRVLLRLHYGQGNCSKLRCRQESEPATAISRLQQQRQIHQCHLVPVPAPACTPSHDKCTHKMAITKKAKGKGSQHLLCHAHLPAPTPRMDICPLTVTQPRECLLVIHDILLVLPCTVLSKCRAKGADPPVVQTSTMGNE